MKPTPSIWLQLVYPLPCIVIADSCHSTVNSFWVWKDAQRAMDEAVGALRLSLWIMD
ncbi:hypothetical protein [Lawsonella clevelandensis]|uniref:hypothetical protein n=1 Tax=Lawsonella clevelandensis TaxID=1528099 RepID=UPI001F1672A3|nr:hypothetical protein [Lawsonella clevelandensis]MDU7194012.1 hypothetical protein [Lawsonella clevelandensis]